MNVGVLGLQGDYQAHKNILDSLKVKSKTIKSPIELQDVDALILPGGESTTLSKLLESSELFETLKKLIQEKMPIMATCAGMILLAKEVINSTKEQKFLSVLDAVIVRNAYGSQLESFEAELEVKELSPPKFHAVFIRAPKVESVGPDVKVLASFEGVPVMIRQDNILAMSFHPELTQDSRIHRYFLNFMKEE